MIFFDACFPPMRCAALRPAIALSLLMTVACSRERGRAPSDSTSAHGVTTGLAAHSPTTLSPDARPAGRAAPDTVASASPVHADTAGWPVSVHGVGAITFGMPISAAARAAGGTVAHPPEGSCGFVSLRDVPHGARFMVSYDTVVRVDVGTPAVATDAGARVGMSEDSVQRLYANKLRTTPHKYVRGGHYLISIPGAPADTMHQLIFETDGDHVTRYRAGLAPYVGYVEACG